MKSTMKVTRLLAALSSLVLLSAHPAAAQEPTGGPPAEGIEREVERVLDRSGLSTRLDSLASTAAPELQEALDRLAVSLSTVAARIASDPELRLAAVQTAEGLLGVAQVTLEQQATQIQEALREMAERLDTLSTPPAPSSERR